VRTHTAYIILRLFNLIRLSDGFVGGTLRPVKGEAAFRLTDWDAIQHIAVAVSLLLGGAR